MGLKNFFIKSKKKIIIIIIINKIKYGLYLVLEHMHPSDAVVFLSTKV